MQSHYLLIGGNVSIEASPIADGKYKPYPMKHLFLILVVISLTGFGQTADD